MTEPAPWYDRTGESNPLMDFEGRRIGPTQIAVLHVLLTMPNGTAHSRNAIRNRMTGSRSPGRVYPVIDSCIASGLIEPLPPDEGTKGPLPWPRMRITPDGARAVVAWENREAAKR